MLSIRDIKVILTAPKGANLVIVKVETSEPGLYGLGCATFTQRHLAVRTAIVDYLKPLLIGRDVDRIEDLWRLMMVSGYWRNGPVLNNAVAGVDGALWDIKGKRAGFPVYQLLGGKCYEAAAVYRHVSGTDTKEVEDRARALMAEGVRHLRIQNGRYGGPVMEGYRPSAALDGVYYDTRLYMRSTLRTLENARIALGDEVEIIHDVHERLNPSEAVEFAKLVEPLRLFFLEDALAPEDLGWFANIRSVSTTPLAMGELFVHPCEWMPLITNRQIDFIRFHISAIGGLTPARKIATMCELNGVRTAWHGPGDVSPIGHAINLHLDLVCPNFGIQEFAGFSDAEREVFPGSPELHDGYLYPNDQPGFGVDINEEASKRFPCNSKPPLWTQARRADGGLARP